MADRLLRVGELAKAVGKTVRAMHLYEELGLLEPVSRSASGYRLYSEDAITRVNWIVKLQEMGFSLPEIQGFLRDIAAAPSAPDAMARVRAIFGAKLAETRSKLQGLTALEKDLQDSLAYLESCYGCEPSPSSVGGCSGCGRRGHETLEAPQLVAGLALPSPARPDTVVAITNLTGGNR